MNEVSTNPLEALNSLIFSGSGNVFIIAGGKSAGRVKPSSLHGEVVLSINDAFKDFRSSILYWMDKSWADNNAAEVHAFGGLKFSSRPFHNEDIVGTFGS